MPGYARRVILTAAVLLAGGAAWGQSQSPSEQFLDVQRKDHAFILAAVEKIQAGEGNQREAVSRLRDLLVPHMRGEEETFYPALQQASGAAAAERAVQEHREAEAILQRVMKMSPEDPQMAGQINLLRESLQAHIKNEEDKVVPLAARKMDSARLQSVLADFQVAKKKAAQSLQ